MASAAAVVDLLEPSDRRNLDSETHAKTAHTPAPVGTLVPGLVIPLRGYLR